MSAVQRIAMALLLAGAAATAPARSAELLEREDVQGFLARMTEQHGFSREQLETAFRDVRISDGILKAIAKPAEILPWYRYREIFLQEDRVRQGLEFWQQNAATLARAREAYGVPEEIIVAIIGVETRYGRNAGSYRVLDALATLAFDYPPRSAFFTAELEQFLLLAREQGFDPLVLKGSYAGAMGIPQFISSSYRNFAVDFDIDGVTDIWQNPVDAIGSVGNYFHRHGWLKGGLVTLPAEPEPASAAPEPAPGLEPDLDAEGLERLGIRPAIPLPGGEKVKLLALELESGREYWLGFRNFYVITRYNRSVHYAMAVYRLAESLRARRTESTADAR